MAQVESTGSAAPTLADIKKEVMRRANARISPFEAIKAEDAQQVVDALASLEHDHWAELWSRLGQRYEAQGDELTASKGG